MEWWNYFFQKFWYQLEPDISKAAIQSVNGLLEQYKPSFISSLILSEFTLGTQAPVIRAVKAFPRVSGDDRAVSSDFLYSSTRTCADIATSLRFSNSCSTLNSNPWSTKT
jgi:Ca2+-dependent lipid-binding protein